MARANFTNQTKRQRELANANARIESERRRLQTQQARLETIAAKLATCTNDLAAAASDRTFDAAAGCAGIAPAGGNSAVPSAAACAARASAFFRARFLSLACRLSFFASSRWRFV